MLVALHHPLRRFSVFLFAFLALTTTLESRASTPTPLDAFPSITAVDLATVFGDLMIEHQVVEGIEEINFPEMQHRFSFFADKEAIWALFEVLHQPALRSVERLVTKQFGLFFNGTEKVLHPATHIAFVAALHGYPASEESITKALHADVVPIGGVDGPVKPSSLVTAPPPIIPDAAMVIGLPTLHPEIREALITFANQVALISGDVQYSKQKSKRPWIIAGIVCGAVVAIGAMAGLTLLWRKHTRPVWSLENLSLIHI